MFELYYTQGDAGDLSAVAHATDAGRDLAASADTEIAPGEFADIPTGVHAAVPPGHWVAILGRSSAIRTHRLLVVTAVIDEGYRGELFVGAVNLGKDPAVVLRGERVAQLVLMANHSEQASWVRVARAEFDALPGGERGLAGFGSTGRAGQPVGQHR